MRCIGDIPWPDFQAPLVRDRPKTHLFSMASLILPALLLTGLAVLVPLLVERRMPETLGGLLLGGLLSALVVWLLSAALFAGLYSLQGPGVLEILRVAPGSGLWHFLKLGAQAALLWAPILVLVVGTSARRWKEAVW